MEVQRVGSGAIVEQRCLGDAAMPLVVELGAAVDQSAEVNVELLTTDVSGCHGADVFAFSFMGLSYLLCMNSAEDTAQVLGNTFVASTCGQTRAMPVGYRPVPRVLAHAGGATVRSASRRGHQPGAKPVHSADQHQQRTADGVPSAVGYSLDCVAAAQVR